MQFLMRSIWLLRNIVLTEVSWFYYKRTSFLHYISVLFCFFLKNNYCLDQKQVKHLKNVAQHEVNHP